MRISGDVGVGRTHVYKQNDEKNETIVIDVPYETGNKLGAIKRLCKILFFSFFSAYFYSFFASHAEILCVPQKTKNGRKRITQK